MQLIELFDRTYKKYWANSKSEETVVINAMTAINFFGKTKNIERITVHDIDEFLTYLEKRYDKNSTINRKISALSRMLTFAHKREFISKKLTIERKREESRRVRYFTEAEENAIYSYFDRCSQHFLTQLCQFACDSGLRRNEIFNLTIGDLDFTKSLILPKPETTKRGDVRTVPMTNRVEKLLTKCMRNNKQITKKNCVITSLFSPEITVAYLDYNWALMREHLKYLDDPGFVFHTFRRTFCSRLAQAEVPIYTIKALAGHKMIETTLRYMHLCPKNLESAIDKLN